MTQLGSDARPLVVAVVGSGPSGFYAVEALLKSGVNVRVHLIERLPVPYGLVRYGVAPDHPKLKQVNLVFHKIAQDPRVHYFGNVEFGTQVEIQDLQKMHHAVILCYGAASDRRLEIPGEDLTGSHTATEFVAWYNGHPDYRHHEFDLSSEVAMIIGQGNVAADVCRILAKPVEDLYSTDIAQHALDQLAESKIREIHVIGRRGPVQAKFTSKELKELGELAGCSTSTSEHGFELSASDTAELNDKANENAAKCFEHFNQFGHSADSTANRRVKFHFLLSPMEIIGERRVEGVVLMRNRLVGKALSQKSESTGETITMRCGLCFRSIGYRGQSLPGAPFDERRGIVPNERGRVLNGKRKAIGRLYTSGWIKRGPSGVIGTNRADSVETVASLMEHLDELEVLQLEPADSFEALLNQKRISAISFSKWKMIDSAETQLGQENGKPREKITSVDQMLAIAG